MPTSIKMHIQSTIVLVSCSVLHKDKLDNWLQALINLKIKIIHSQYFLHISLTCLNKVIFEVFFTNMNGFLLDLFPQTCVDLSSQPAPTLREYASIDRRLLLGFEKY